MTQHVRESCGLGAPAAGVVERFDERVPRVGMHVVDEVGAHEIGRVVIEQLANRW